jgi:hypothetical protein
VGLKGLSLRQGLLPNGDQTSNNFSNLTLDGLTTCQVCPWWWDGAPYQNKPQDQRD